MGRVVMNQTGCSRGSLCCIVSLGLKLDKQVPLDHRRDKKQAQSVAVARFTQPAVETSTLTRHTGKLVHWADSSPCPKDPFPAVLTHRSGVPDEPGLELGHSSAEAHVGHSTCRRVSPVPI